MSHALPHFLHLAQGIDVAPLLAQLHAKPALFGVHSYRASGSDSPHKAMSDIWVRYNDIANLGQHFNDEHDAVWYPAYAKLPALKPLIFGLMHHVGGERLGGVLITKLPPGGEILTHTDSGWHAAYYQKFFIAIQNEPGALFRFPGGDVAARTGDCYWFDNSVPHSVINASPLERIALIVCIKTPAFPPCQAEPA